MISVLPSFRRYFTPNIAVCSSCIEFCIMFERSVSVWMVCFTCSVVMLFGFLFWSMEGLIFSIMSLMNPGGSFPLLWASRVACIAPQLSCPRTIIRGTFRIFVAYSREPSTALSSTCPAVLTTNMSPSPTSKISSAASLESEQPNTAA